MELKTTFATEVVHNDPKGTTGIGTIHRITISFDYGIREVWESDVARDRFLKELEKFFDNQRKTIK